MPNVSDIYGVNDLIQTLEFCKTFTHKCFGKINDSTNIRKILRELCFVIGILLQASGNT